MGVMARELTKKVAWNTAGFKEWFLATTIHDNKNECSWSPNLGWSSRESVKIKSRKMLVSKAEPTPFFSGLSTLDKCIRVVLFVCFFVFAERKYLEEKIKQMDTIPHVTTKELVM